MSLALEQLFQFGVGVDDPFGLFVTDSRHLLGGRDQHELALGPAVEDQCLDHDRGAGR